MEEIYKELNITMYLLVHKKIDKLDEQTRRDIETCKKKLQSRQTQHLMCHFVRPNFTFSRTSYIPGTLSEISYEDLILNIQEGFYDEKNYQTW